MADSNHIFKFEGDATQPLPVFTYRYRREILTKRVRPAYARVIFKMGDLEDYWRWVELRRKAITSNRMILSEYGISGAGGRIGGGFWFSVVPIAGAQLVTEITIDDVTYSIETVPVYAGVLALTLNIYKDGVLNKAISVLNDQPFRTGVDTSGKDWQFELVGNVETVKRLDIASSVDELMSIGKQNTIKKISDIIEEDTA